MSITAEQFEAFDEDLAMLARDIEALYLVFAELRDATQVGEDATRLYRAEQHFTGTLLEFAGMDLPWGLKGGPVGAGVAPYINRIVSEMKAIEDPVKRAWEFNALCRFLAATASNYIYESVPTKEGACLYDG